MAIRFAVRRRIIEVTGRLLALRDEAVSPANAVGILAEGQVIARPRRSDGDTPLSQAIHAIVPPAASCIADYVRASESLGRGDDVLRFFSSLDPESRRWRGSLSVIGVEFVVLLAVVLIYSLFVLPVLQSAFDTSGASFPRFTRLVLAVFSPTSPLIWLWVFVIVVAVVWQTAPRLFGPLTGPLDRLVLALPGVGDVIRRNNAIRASGWLGFASADPAGQRLALDAARIWSPGALSRICAAVLAEVDSGGDISVCLDKSAGFDREFRATLAMQDHADSIKALRARWRVHANHSQISDGVTVVLTHLALGIVVAALVIAMYLPVFKLAALN